MFSTTTPNSSRLRIAIKLLVLILVQMALAGPMGDHRCLALGGDPRSLGASRPKGGPSAPVSRLKSPSCRCSGPSSWADSSSAPVVGVDFYVLRLVAPFCVCHRPFCCGWCKMKSGVMNAYDERYRAMSEVSQTDFWLKIDLGRSLNPSLHLPTL